MRVSMSVTNYSWPGGPDRLAADLTELAQAADRSGIDTLWVQDHLMQADPNATAQQRDMLEAYTALAYLAGKTERIRLGAAVSPVTMRSPALLIKAVTTLDVLSGGRAWFGVGAGYHEAEAAEMGLDLPPVAERFERLEELLRLARQMWAGDESPFHGAHYRLDRPQGAPLPQSRPHPPILIGGTGARRTLRLVAQYADACNLFDVPDGGATVRRNLEVLAGHCADVGRRFEDIEKTLATRVAPGESSDEFAARCAAAAELGIDHMVVITAGPWTLELLNILAGAIPKL